MLDPLNSNRYYKKGENIMYNWITPNDTILPNPTQSNPGSIYSGDSIAEFISSVGFPCKHIRTTSGASVATYHISLKDIRQIKKVNNAIPMLEANLNCAVIRGESDIAHFSLMIPRKERDTVHLKSAMMSTAFTELRGIPACLGTDAEGNTLALDISQLPHMIISGSTGSGKSVLVNSMVTSMIFRSAPSVLQFVLIDPKKSEFFQFANIPHLFTPVVTDTHEAIHTLSEMCRIMDERSAKLESIGKRDIEGTDFSRIVIVIDELADIMMVSDKEVEDYIVRIAQRGRSCGIHIILATQSPRASVLTGLIRSNIITKIALRCATQIDSRISLGKAGAEKLLGKGDGIIQGLPGDIKEYRFQGAWISPQDIQYVTGYWNSPYCKSPVQS